jgi:hypothetical protein
MKWELIEKSGSVERSWNFARHYLNDNQDTLDVISMNLPVNSFETFEFHVESSIMFRDLIFTVRPITAWAVSNRVIDFNELHLDEQEVSLLGTREKLQVQLQTCINRVNAGEKKDYVKENLPLMTATKYSIKIDLRTLLSFLYTLQLHSPKYFDIVYNNLIKYKELSEILDIDNFNKFRKADMYQKLSLNSDEMKLAKEGKSLSMGSMHLVSGTSSANIMAQFIRQHGSIIKNGLWNLFVGTPDKLMNSDSTIIIPVLGYIEDSAFRNLLSTRTCYFAQMDKAGPTSWDCILSGFLKNISPEKFLELLPCHGDCNKCKIRNEMIPRVDGRDSNTPCPILIENPMTISKRIEEYNSNSSVMDMWKSLMYNNLIRYNNGNELNIQYLKLLRDKNDN